ncbi:MAG: hypothetical protein WD533_05280, partial [Dehalococcoidia bacterium]
MEYGITVKQDHGGARVVIRAQNQAGLLYAVPAEGSWVATPEQLPAHALAGFLNELVQRDDPAIRALMHKWGVYFRPLPLDEV